MNKQMPRIESISHLATMCEAALDVDSIAAQEQASQHVRLTTGILPTIGCEIEIKWSSLFPEIADEYFGAKDTLGEFERAFDDLSPVEQDELNALRKVHETELLPAYQATCDAGIPAGSDAFWEFANAPAYSARTLSTEVKLLFHAGFIPEGHHHALHVTLGGLALGRGGAHMVLAGLELLHGLPERFILATQGTKYATANTWARRGREGIRQRTSEQLQLNDTIGIEFRTLTIASSEAADDLFSDAQNLGSILLAYRQHAYSPSHLTQPLRPLWDTYRQRIKDLMHAYQLPSEPWGKPHENAIPWLRWAGVISEAPHSTSEAAAATNDIKAIVKEADELLASLRAEVPRMPLHIVDS